MMTWRERQIAIMTESPQYLNPSWPFDSFRPATGEWLSTLYGKIVRTFYDCGCVETDGALTPCSTHQHYPCATWRPTYKNVF